MTLSWSKFSPDYTFICKLTGLHIDIEIDEPYVWESKEPIHFIGSFDDERNNVFLSRNWCLIRFAEEQVVSWPDDCVGLINNFVKAIQNKSLQIQNTVPVVSRWSYDDSINLAKTNSRNRYL